jgi:putative redox protein
MGDSRPPTIVELDWDAELRFRAVAGANRLTIDSDGAAGPSPMQALALALAGCMGVDLIHILTRGRHDLRAVHARLAGHRADTEPQRFVSIALHFTVTGDVAASHVQRAIDLSRDKYCSVWNSLRQDIRFEVTYDITTP